MRLKVLIVPFFIVMVLVIFIGYIQPDISVLETQKAELGKKSDQVANMEAVVSNVDTLNQSLDNHKELRQFMGRYFPKGMDQGRVIDAFNFLASQSGLLIVTMTMEEPSKAMAVAEGPVINPVTGLPITEPVFKDPVEETYVASVKVRGSYENIKAFFDRVSHMDRFHRVSNLVIGIPDANEAAMGTDSDTPAPKATGDLVGVFEAKFDYFPGRSVQTAIAVPVFSKSELDFSVLQKELDRVTSPVADLEYTPAGKPNPFQ